MARALLQNYGSKKGYRGDGYKLADKARKTQRKGKDLVGRDEALNALGLLEARRAQVSKPVKRLKGSEKRRSGS